MIIATLRKVGQNFDAKIYVSLEIVNIFPKSKTFFSNLVSQRWTHGQMKHCFLTMFLCDGRTCKHCVVAMFHKAEQPKTLFLATFHKPEQIWNHYFLAMFLEGGLKPRNINCFLSTFRKGRHLRKHCFPAIFPEGGQTRKH